ncbi:YopX family protein [Enterococcus faecalis]|uniref:YopX family protein n=1 Tax=Enterococcus faecalis TaxID=1351 RepID=UPI002032DE14|nr:YopX family protein [Enterococcus faecalis]
MIPKFRAWDKRENTMRDVAVLHFTKGGKVNSIEYWKTPSELKSYHVRNLVLMQSTGLKDKNGVEIFEGDILKIIEVTNEGISEYITDVIWEDCSFVFKSDGVDYYDSFSGSFSGDPNKTYPLFELLVIGNVWDNPELLESVQNERF